MWFQPTFQKHAGRLCGSLQLHVTDRSTFRPVRTGLAVLAALRNLTNEPGGSSPRFRFAWRTEEYEFIRDPIAIDLLFGSDRERLTLESGASWREIAAGWEPEESEWLARRAPSLLY